MGTDDERESVSCCVGRAVQAGISEGFRSDV